MLGCPEHAISQKDSGAVVIDENKCVGCGYCRTKAAMTKLAEERLKEVRMNHPNAQLYGLPANPKTPESIDLRRDYIRPLGKIAVGSAAAGLAGLMILNKLIGNKGA